MQFMRN